MSTLTKIFVVFNFIMSIVFLCISGMLFGFKQDYKAKYDFKKKEAEVLARKIKAVKDVEASEVGSLQAAVENLTKEQIIHAIGQLPDVKIVDVRGEEVLHN